MLRDKTLLEGAQHLAGTGSFLTPSESRCLVQINPFMAGSLPRPIHPPPGACIVTTAPSFEAGRLGAVPSAAELARYTLGEIQPRAKESTQGCTA